MVETKLYNSTQEKINKIQSPKGKITLSIYQILTKYYDEIYYRR